MEALPIDQPPAEVPDLTGPVPQIRRVIAIVEFADGHAEEVPTFAYRWTADRVLVGVLGNWSDSSLMASNRHVWVPADRVRRPDLPPVPGERDVSPKGGPTAVVLVAPDECPNGHSMKGAGFFRNSCMCPGLGRAHGGRGWYSWSCPTCQTRVSGPPPHDTEPGRIGAPPN